MSAAQISFEAYETLQTPDTVYATKNKPTNKNKVVIDVIVLNTYYWPHVFDVGWLFSPNLDLTDVADEWSPIQQKKQLNHIHCKYT